MTNLPIVHMTLYKHGVGYYRRRGPVDGQSIKLTFRREEMDDLLKSLTIIDHAGGQVRGVDYDTPQSQAERLAGCSISLDDTRSLRGLLVALRGRLVQLQVSDGSSVTGTLVGLDEDDEKPLEQSLVSVLQEKTEAVVVLALKRIEAVELRDDTAAADLRFFLQTALGQETHRSITIRLSPHPHDLEVSYIAPAPTWRVSYRFVIDAGEADAPPEALLQGWGIFDNRLEEDLTDISLSLTAGMPISFVYDLYTPRTPSRPVVEDESRVAAAPVMFEAAMAEDTGIYPAAPAPAMAAPLMKRARAASGVSSKGMTATVESSATGQAMGELFQYNVSVPVTVGRGQSAMVPIVSSRLSPKKDLIYNGSKMPTHPVATLRFKNSTGLTLERGPVTVLEVGEYVGEAVLPFTASQAEAVVSYAVELGVHIAEETSVEQQLHSLEIKDAYLVQHHYEIHRTVYRMDNRTPLPKTVLIERPVHSHRHLFETAAPVEETLEYRRFKVEVEPGKLTSFTVQERYLRSKREELISQSYEGLRRYLDQKLLDKQTYEGLKTLLDAREEIARLQNRISEQESRRAQIFKAQEQVQKNMAALASTGEEGRLRGRYVQQLTHSEEELAGINQIVAQTQTEIKQKEAQIMQIIAALGSAAGASG